MPQLIWSPAALRDMQRLYRFLARDNVEAAKRATKAVHQGLKVLKQQPAIARPIDNMGEEFREWIIDFGDSGYLVRFHARDDVLTILAVRHQKEAGF